MSQKVTISCFGGCGRSVTLRKSKVLAADYYLCKSRASGVLCESKLPPLLPGKVRRICMNAAASFWGYTDDWADEETTAAIMRARDILAAGITKLAIKKAQRGD